MLADCTRLTVVELGALIQRRELSPLEVTQAYLSRIDRLDGRLRAFLRVYPEQALEAAAQAEREIAAGRTRGAPHGIPIALKDIFDAAGMVTTCGAALRREHAPAWEDAFCVARLRQAGMVILGKLATHEFAGGPTGINPHFGTPQNPWKAGYIPGGSSSGSGVAVAAGLVPAALGSDTGGSVRIPAHLCGIVGLKPTHGLISLRGIYPVAPTLDHAGPMTRTVADTALLLRALAGHDPADRHSRAQGIPDQAAPLSGGLRGLRIGVPRDFFFDGLHPEVERAVRAAIGVLGELGAELREVALPDAEAIFRSWEALHLVEWNLVHGENLAKHRDRIGQDIVTRLERVARLGPLDYARALAFRECVIADLPSVMGGCELLAAPAGMIPAVPIENPVVAVNGKEVRAVEVNGRLTRLAAFTGQPAIAVPCGFTGGGLPIGLQLIGLPFRDDQVLRAAYAYEQATDWHRRRPALD
jgi:aspartyl-tRNA(Asn)/glutamyl-tRNA(Gln) amidotransferase subunit A